MSQTILEIKLLNATELRIQLDVIINYTKQLHFLINHDFYIGKKTHIKVKDSVKHFINLLSEANTALFFAKSYLGIEKGNLGSKHPYPPSDTAKNIPPTVDVSNVNIPLPDLKGDLERDIDLLTQTVNEIRQYISKILSNNIFLESILNANPIILLCYGNIREANFLLGAMLSEFRDLANIYIPDEKEFY